jgi:predicted CDP-diglyceride synthetase/phosphatidate cytidylyltransferase
VVTIFLFFPSFFSLHLYIAFVSLLNSKGSWARAALWWAAPPFQPWQAALAGLVVATMGFAGGMTMSAIKRDRGVKDYGTLVVGHGGVLDRFDGLLFVLPTAYFVTLLFNVWTVG